MIEARIILDSVNPSGNRLTTWLLTYPRFIHSEFMTHRVFSRNSASSRAIPIEKQITAVHENPATFEFWGKNQKGMQADVEFDQYEQVHVKDVWEAAGESAIEFAQAMSKLGAHKQIANRLLEPFAHMTVLATATDHSNFFRLRAHPMAQPEFQVLAYRMLALYINSVPQPVGWEGWHLPGLDAQAAETFDENERLKIVTALAARASFAAFDEGIECDDAYRIHDSLAANGHWSPFEHAAQAIENDHAGRFRSYPWSNFDWPGNGGPSGWGQYRKLFAVENVTNITTAQLADILNARPTWVKV